MTGVAACAPGLLPSCSKTHREHFDFRTATVVSQFAWPLRTSYFSISAHFRRRRSLAGNGTGSFVVVQHLIHGSRGFGAPSCTDHAGGDTGDCHVFRNRLQDYGSSGNSRAVTDPDVAEDFRASTDHDPAANLRMAIRVFLARAA